MLLYKIVETAITSLTLKSLFLLLLIFIAKSCYAISSHSPYSKVVELNRLLVMSYYPDSHFC